MQEALGVDRSYQDEVGASFGGADIPASKSEDVFQTDSGKDEGRMPSSFVQAAPLNEAELLALLLASPLYQKLENVKKAVAVRAARNAFDGSAGRVGIFFFEYILRMGFWLNYIC